VPSGRKAVVFDIDATLTTSDTEVFEEILAGAVPEMRAAADQVVERYADKGYFVVYLTGRPYFLDPASRSWLADLGFPRGPIRTTDSVSEALPTEGGVGAHKQAYLEELTDGPGVDLRYAYGNASTDVCAFARAGIAPERTYIIGDHGGEACEGYGPSQALTDYPSHLPTLDDLPPGD
jgi:phosphatidate phosphatase PAH1